MKAFITAQLTEDVIGYLSDKAEIRFGGWGATSHVLTSKELVEQAADADILIICYEPIDEYVFTHLPNLKLICCTRGGVENIDKQAMRNHPEVFVCNAPGRNANAVADLTVALMLDVIRSISLSNHYIRNQDWEHVKWFKAGKLGKKMFMGYELEGKVLGLIGFGEVGSRVARRAKGFGMQVWVYDPYVASLPEGIRETDLNTLLKGADFVSLHCKLADETRKMMDAEKLSLMKPTAVLINTARGGLVDEAALYACLREHAIFGAGLDTIAVEPMEPDHPFIGLENIVITPHIGGASYDIVHQQSAIILQDLVGFFEENKPVHVMH